MDLSLPWGVLQNPWAREPPWLRPCMVSYINYTVLDMCISFNLQLDDDTVCLCIQCHRNLYTLVIVPIEICYLNSQVYVGSVFNVSYSIDYCNSHIIFIAVTFHAIVTSYYSSEEMVIILPVYFHMSIKRQSYSRIITIVTRLQA